MMSGFISYTEGEEERVERGERSLALAADSATLLCGAPRGKNESDLWPGSAGWVLNWKKMGGPLPA